MKPNPLSLRIFLMRPVISAPGLLRRSGHCRAPTIDRLAAPAIEHATEAPAKRGQRVGTEKHAGAGDECEKLHEGAPFQSIACIYRCRNRKPAVREPSVFATNASGRRKARSAESNTPA